MGIKKMEVALLGAAYVFDYDGENWNQSSKLLAIDGQGYNFFGHSVSLNGNRALIGANNNSNVNGNSTGAAYVFEYEDNSWIQTSKLIANDGIDYVEFGSSVSLGVNRALIGAPNRGTGHAYLFDFDGISWSQTIKFLASDASHNDRFGNSVSLWGDRVLIGAIWHKDNF